MGLALASTDTEIVATRVERPKSPPTQVDCVVATNARNPTIIDLFAEGTSLRRTQAADFTAYLARRQYNIHELVAGMRQRLAQN
jgi:phospholipid transport system substrate-binding protein